MREWSFSVSSIKMAKVSKLFGARHFYLYIAVLILLVIVLAVERFMHRMSMNFEHYHLENDKDFELVTLPKEFAFPRGAKCLDGSSPAFYYRKSPVQMDLWIIHLLPGAWCVSVEECYNRSQSKLGSSRLAPTSLLLDGMFSNDCNQNSLFCMWNVAVFLYCDGGSFLGNASLPYKFKEKPVYMRGAVIFDTLVDYLNKFTSFNSAKQVILSGSSAGGIGALVHADRLRSRLSEAVTFLHVIVDAALFVDVPDIQSHNTMRELFKSLYSLHSLKDSESLQECTRTLSAEDGWKCLFPAQYHSFVFSPVFYLNSIFDTWQRHSALKISCSTSSCPDQDTEVVNKARDAIQDIVRRILQSKKNGVYLTPCPRHTIFSWASYFVKLGNISSVKDTLSSWIAHNEPANAMNFNPNLKEVINLCGEKW